MLQSSLHVQSLIELTKERLTYLQDCDEDRIDCSKQVLKDIIQEAIDQGDEAFRQLKEKNIEEPEKVAKAFVFIFQWAEKLKDFFVLWRSSWIEMLKAQLMQYENRIEEKILGDFWHLKIEKLREAIEEIETGWQNRLQILQSDHKLFERQIRSWGFQDNPWPVYLKQYQEIFKQLDKQLEELQLHYKSADNIQSIIQLILDQIDHSGDELNKVEASLENIEDMIYRKENQNIGKLVDVVKTIDESSRMFEGSHFLRQITDSLEDQISRLPSNEKFAMPSNSGIIPVLEIPIRKKVLLWVEGNILPKLLEINESEESMVHAYKVAVNKVRNKIQILLKEKETVEITETLTIQSERPTLANPIKECKKNLTECIGKMHVLRELIAKELGTQLKVSRIYEVGNNFLSIPIQSTINQWRFSRKKFFERSRNWFSLQGLPLQALTRSVRQEESLSISEKIIRYIQRWRPETNNQQYNYIFLAKGFVGDAFLVNREEEILRTQQTIESWSKGYRGSVLISGGRFVGKSLFGELIGSRFFPNHTLHLLPGNTIRVQGRKMEVGHDLSEALDFIHKYAEEKEYMVWIDDVEQWWTPDYPLFYNVDELIKSIDSNSRKLFYVVSTNKWMLSHLSDFYDIDRIFQTHVRLGKMMIQEVKEAIAIRHGATHRSLVDSEKVDLPPTEIEKYIDKIYRIAKGNIGESIYRWSSSIKRINNEQVQLKHLPKYHLPGFISDDIGMVLASFLLYKTISDYELRKLYGPPYKTRYQHIVQRLLGLGILFRRSDNQLEITESAANEIGRRLIEKRIIRE